MTRLHTIPIILLFTAVAAISNCSSESPGSGVDTDAAGTVGADGGDLSTDGLFTPGDLTEEDGALEIGGDGPFEDIGEQEDATEEVFEDASDGDIGEDVDLNMEDLNMEDLWTEYPGRFEECGFGRPECEDPYECVNGRCHLTCEGECPDDEVCIDIEYSRDDICGRSVGEGERCDEELATICEDELFCDEETGTCQGADTVEQGEVCDGEEIVCEGELICYVGRFEDRGRCEISCEDDPEICEPGETCAGMGGEAVCLEACDPRDDPECEDGYECQGFGGPGGGEPACYPVVGEEPGEQAFGEVCDDGNRCQEGFTCPPMIPGGYCTSECDSSNPCPDSPAGAECVNLYFGSYCLFVCDDSDECPEGMSCSNMMGMSFCSF